MVSIVIVSHSAKLAEGTRELAQQMAQGEICLAVAGGIDDPENPIGTDAIKVLKAIESVYSEDGVVILMDLGSALLSAEMALEFIPHERRNNVYLCEAPLVEGAVAAVVQASIGGSIEDVLAAARGALRGKIEQLDPESTSGDVAVGGSNTGVGVLDLDQESQELQLTVSNRLGLHIRPAASLVGTANRYQSEIFVSKGDKLANAKSINQVMMLGARQGDAIVVMAAGADATEALSAFQTLADDNFGDRANEDIPLILSTIGAVAVARGAIQGITASPGVAIGPVVKFQAELPESVVWDVDNPGAEWDRFQGALAKAGQEIQALYQAVRDRVGVDEAGVFEAHLLFLEDPALIDVTKVRIFERKVNAEAAWQEVIEEIAEAYQALEDDTMRARAIDVRDVGERVMRQLVGNKVKKVEWQQPSILVAADLTPSDAAQMDPAKVLGICTALGGETSHSAILAKALGIPAVAGLGPILEDLTEGQTIVVDGEKGLIWPNPDADLLAKLREKQAVWERERAQTVKAGKEMAITPDGQRIEIMANIGRPEDAITALAYGAEGVGLFRTEFLFLDRSVAPTEDEQYDAYRQVAQSMGSRPVIVRTLDIGGDKPVPYLDMGREDNPFLGRRGIRFCLERPNFFKTQLRAILRAGVDHNLKIMFPMLSSVGELMAAKGLLIEAGEELSKSGASYDEQMEVGIMIEVPAAVATADLLAAKVDFFSIGTNDLTQYVMAADRGNLKVAGLVDALQPAVLRMVAQTIQAGHAAGIWVGMCGELAGNPLATSMLLGLGLDKFSMNPPAIPMVKKNIRKLELKQAREVAETVLGFSTASAVRAYLAGERPID